MAQMIESARHTDTVKDFYNSLSGDYDLMTDFQGRFVRERPFFHMLIDRHHIHSAVDAGSGTGFHSMLLAQLGVKMTAVDVSPAMISSVRDHASRLDLEIKTLVASFEELPEVIGGSVDAIVSLGNSLAHAGSHEELLSWLHAFASVLNPNGILFIQNLNYDRILMQNEKVLNTRKAGDKTFERFYEYDGDRLIFNIRTTKQNANGVDQHQGSVSLLPLLKSDLFPALESAGFEELQAFGGISMGPFLPAISTDLVILAKLGTGRA